MGPTIRFWRDRLPRHTRVLLSSVPVGCQDAHVPLVGLDRSTRGLSTGENHLRGVGRDVGVLRVRSQIQSYTSV